MAGEILLPRLFPEMDVGVIVEWHKNEGDAIKAGEHIADIETDKAVAELEAPEDGVIEKILVQAGTEVAVETPLATLVGGGSGAKAVAAGTVASVVQPAIEEPRPAASTPQSDSPTGRLFASPIARHLANREDVDLADLVGTGPGGRITKGDVLAAIERKPAAVAPAPAPAQVDVPSKQIPLSSMRKTIAARMTQSKQETPHAYLSADCRIDDLLGLRERANERNAKAGMETKLSINDFVIRAASLALQKTPEANVSWTDEGITQHSDVSIAVAVNTPAGLITPVIRNAHEKTVSALSKELRELANRAREGKLTPDEYRGGTFTVTNLGMFGVQQFYAIINPPQAAILAVGAAEERPIAVDGMLTVGRVMTCTLAVDHRALDGVVGAKLLGAFKEHIESPETLLL